MTSHALAASAKPAFAPAQLPIVQAYEGAQSAAAGVASGFRTVDSNSNAWYLTHPAGWCEHGAV